MIKGNRQRSLSREQSKVRVLAIYLMIQEGRTLSCQTILRRLWSQYGITADRKSIYNDLLSIDRICPLECIPGCHGGYRKLDVLGGRRWVKPSVPALCAAS